MNIAWDDLRTVLCLVRSGSLAGAAAALDVNYTTVARRVRRAEESLGETLFERLADGYQPTEAARLIAEHAGHMEEMQDDLLRRLQGRDTALSGALTITAPELVLMSFLSPMLAEFTQTHPQIDLRVLATNDLLDLTRREADLAIRISKSPGDSLKGLRLLEQQVASFASPDWAQRIERNPEGPIDWVIFDGYDAVPSAVSPEYPNNRVRLKMSDMVAILGATQAGLGVARLPLFLGRKTDGVVQVPVLPPQPYADLWVVAHPDVWPSAKVQAFLTPLVAYCKAHRALFLA